MTKATNVIKLAQSPVQFIGETHEYYLGDKKLKGITGSLVERAYPDTYKKPDNYTDEQWEQILKTAADKGSVVHETIELYEDLGITSDLPELKNYIAVKGSNGFIHVASEYVVSDNEVYASAIDQVWQKKGSKGVWLIDIKRTSTIHTENVALQLSIYKMFFEMMNPNIPVEGIAVLWLRDDNVKFIELNPVAEELITELMAADIDDRPFSIVDTYGVLPTYIYDVQDEIIAIDKQMKEAKKRNDELKKGLLSLMQEHNIKSYSASKLQLTQILPTVKQSVDTSKLKEKYPDVYADCLKESAVSASLKITIKKVKK